MNEHISPFVERQYAWYLLVEAEESERTVCKSFYEALALAFSSILCSPQKEFR